VRLRWLVTSGGFTGWEDAMLKDVSAAAYVAPIRNGLMESGAFVV